MRLETLQRAMIDAIDMGPDHVPDAAFAGGRQRVLRGLAVHANTISHARLVALEETFPRTRTLIGEQAFNRLSRAFVETAAAKSRPLSLIGSGFGAFLNDQRETSTDAIALAAFEWAWLESYHAAERDALALSDFADADEQALLNTIVALHPAARIAPIEAAAALENEVPGLAEADADAGAEAILLTRPQADVLIAPASTAMVRQFALLGAPQPFCNLLGSVDEQAGAQGLQASIAMLKAGALVLPR